jgi:hypothetical protein
MGEIISQDVSGRLKRSLGHYTDLTSLTSQLADKASKNITYVNALDMPNGFTNFVRNDSTKDNSQALQYLFDNATSTDGVFVVYFPIGNYYFSTNVTKRSPRNIVLTGSQGRGDYASTTRFIFKGTGAFIDIKCANPVNDN